jgi:hypothetical protein
MQQALRGEFRKIGHLEGEQSLFALVTLPAFEKIADEAIRKDNDCAARRYTMAISNPKCK